MEIKLNLEEMKEIGFDSNILAQVVEGNLILAIDLSQDLGLSSSKKTKTIANSAGFQTFPEGLKGNIYIGRKVK